MNKPKILVSSCIRNRAWILPKYLEAILNIKYDGIFDCFFLENDSTDNSLQILEDFSYENYDDLNIGISTINSCDNIPDETRTQYRLNGYKHLADIRNKLLDNILSFYNDYEYVLFIDSDIVVPSNIIDELLKYADNKTIVAAAISNIPNRTVDGTTPCNFMKLNGNRMEHMVKYPTSGVIEVDLTGAVYLVPMQCLKDGVRYDANQQGEDNPFCDSAKEKGYKLLVNLDCKPKHYMVKGENK